MNNIYLALGSNRGDRVDNLKKAVQKINSPNNCSVTKISSIYETKPYGEIEQQNFYNAVIEITYHLNPEKLFELVKQIENEIGRTKTVKWGPREIDIDILLFGNQYFQNDEITIPHKDMLNRDFVLLPLLEINKEIIHPVEQVYIKDLDFNQLQSNIIRKFQVDFLG
ncbi:MAG: 2-amino-4-hydroxy-6-hydroxymethyldihydropteridine diphosphokinase [Melioribacteraceae bacterium]|nr:2-amino-4-hydroxy-6-hydroxymethyldihydropteridine diphosphokinase [Melioribacteraceae bacterium]MCF8353967.1 2-amino-4-hydroxy-6-hydroxymethyldihydropteridine diphosphokinase [Melioribacteraceae bacterium]MCF8393695.1 2-amino-4-hydroxy-6-hydroxymethyldihydropteridine diphosphokinase [Melioribacteraceae bacterium]MCF8419563.1 2-amino-4-hydroxy-6-hydroxymethyldihydropteridine diphosphokinase [Melioribacteraceae bacterium]